MVSTSTMASTFSDAPAGPLFTCMACRVGFRHAEGQRNHYKTDWHRYNLKRKMAELPPLTAVEFRAKVLQQAQCQAVTVTPEYELKCVPCGKKFNSIGAAQSHRESKKHKETMKKFEAGKKVDTSNREQKQKLHPAVEVVQSKSTVASHENEKLQTESTLVEPKPTNEKKDLGTNDDNMDFDMEGEEIDYDNLPEPEPDVELVLEDCLFCTHRSDSLEESLKHMNYAHGFFIPDVEYLTDLKGLIGYLQDKVSRYHICLLCNGRGKAFHSTEAVRNHMCSLGHCFVEYEQEGQIELEDFYDFKPSWDEYYKKNPRAAEKENDDDSDWSDVDEEDEVSDAKMVEDSDEAKEAAVENQIALLHKAGRTIDFDGLDMVLPSGARVGHRAMRRFYKQKFATPDERDSVVIQKLVTEYKAIGLPGYGSGAPTPEARRQRDKAMKSQMYSKMRLGMKNNKSEMNKHFREQNTQ